MSSTNPTPPLNNNNNNNNNNQPQTYVAQETPQTIMQTQTIIQQPPPQAPLTNVVDPNGVAVPPNNDPKINNEEFEEIREQVRTFVYFLIHIVIGNTIDIETYIYYIDTLVCRMCIS